MFSISFLAVVVTLVIIANGNAQDSIADIQANYLFSIEFEGAVNTLCDSAGKPGWLSWASIKSDLVIFLIFLILLTITASNQINAYALKAMNEIMQDYRKEIGADLVFTAVSTEKQDGTKEDLVIPDEDNRSLLSWFDTWLNKKVPPPYAILPPRLNKRCGIPGLPRCKYVLVIDGNCCCQCRPFEPDLDDGFRSLRSVMRAPTLAEKVEMDLTKKLGFALSDDISAKTFECLEGVTGVTAHLVKKE